MKILKMAAIIFANCCTIVPVLSAEYSAGGFSFSDELGGFRLVSVSGEGSRASPFVIVEEIKDILPAILVIRREFGSGEQRGWHDAARLDQFHVSKLVINHTNKVWSGFEIELREVLDRPSPLGDGLSFDQIMQFDQDVASSRFSRQQRLFEPRDRIHFDQGYVDPGKEVLIRVPITDPTPVGKFYLIQLPSFLVASGG